MINMKTIYTVYQLNEKRNKLGNPYIGFTDNLIRRSKVWKRQLKLDYIPELIPLYTDTSAQRAFNWEQDKRVENGWRRERPLSHLRKISKKGGIRNAELGNLVKAGKIGGKVSGKNHVKSGHMKKMVEKAAKLKSVVTKEQYNEIKKEYKELDSITYKKLSEKYNVSTTTIFKVIHNKIKHFKD